MISQWILPASLTLVCWGVWSFIPKITTRYISPMSAMFTSMSPLITLALGWIVLKEPITLKEGLGIISAFAAICFFAG
nr:EamA family transporter [uncultured Desulfobacter sp.]